MRPVVRCTLQVTCGPSYVVRCMLHAACCTFARQLSPDGPQVVGALLEQLADPRLQRRRDRNHDLPHSILYCARMSLRIGFNVVRRKISLSVVCCIIGFDRNHSLQRTHRPTHAGANTNAPHKHACTHARAHAGRHAGRHARTHARTHAHSQPGDRRMQGRHSAAVCHCMQACATA